MLEPKAQISLSYNDIEFKYFLIACMNALKTNNDENKELVITMFIENPSDNSLRFTFNNFVFENKGAFYSYVDYEDIENTYGSDSEEAFLLNFVKEKLSKDKTYSFKKCLYYTFKIPCEIKNMLSHSSIILNFYEEGETFEIEINDIYVGDNILSSKGLEHEYTKNNIKNLFDRYCLFEKGKDFYYVRNYNRVLLPCFEGLYSFYLYDLAKNFLNKNCILSLNGFLRKSKIIQDKKNILDEEPYKISTITDFCDRELSFKEVFTSMNLNFLSPFIDYANDFNMGGHYYFLLPNTPSVNVPIIHKFCGGTYLFVYDTNVLFDLEVKERY